MTIKLHFVNKIEDISCHFYLTDWERNPLEGSFSLPGGICGIPCPSFEESGAVV